jgi:hypothetical protein
MHILTKFRSPSWKERFLAFWSALAFFFALVYIAAMLVDERKVVELRITLFDHVYAGPTAALAGLLITPVCAALLVLTFATLESFGNFKIRK